MKSLALLLLLAAFLSPSSSSPGEARGEGAFPSTARGAGARFEYLDVYIDPHGQALAAYQFELSVDANAALIVGVEGGEHAAFKQAPYYDPAALSHNRIIIAAFNTGSDLPGTKTRVARLHMRVTGDAPQYKLAPQTTAAHDGQLIDAAISVEKGKTP